MPYANIEEKRAYDRAYGNARKEKRAKRVKTWRENNRERMRLHSRRHHLARAFNMTLEEYADRLARQNGVCAICGTADTRPWSVFDVDHDHGTGQVRGLLCHPCNVILGQCKDDANTLRAAVAYLERCSRD